MFTGLIEELGVIRGIVRGTESARLSIEGKKVLEDMKIGDSIAVNGVCLTATRWEHSHFHADVMAETLSKTGLGHLKTGDKVNLERSLKVGDRLGGHIVTGHIDGVGTILRIEKRDIATVVTVSAPPAVMRYIIKKGSVAIDGASLTVVDFNENTFQVSLIPHTAGMTTLGIKTKGQTVNLEGDVVGKFIERLLDRRQTTGKEETCGGVTMELLMEKGFF